jgi:hypothetical protein
MPTPNSPAVYQPPLALRWNRLTCAAIYYTKTQPTIAARALAMVHTAMYDAWTAYCGEPEKYVSTSTGDQFKRPPAECTQPNREKAFSYAAYRVLMSLFGERLPKEHKDIFAKMMKERGYDITDQTLDVTKPQGIGNLSAKLVIDYRQGDGSNEQCDYADYTGYKPVNEPAPKRPIKDVEKWQPQQYPAKEPQKFMTPHWGFVKPFALEWGGQFRPPPPVDKDNPKFEQQAEKLIHISACLNDEQKIIAELWAGMHEDKFPNCVVLPNHNYWVVPPVQWCRIARYIAEKNCFMNGSTIKMFFLLANGLLDASIAAWDAMRFYDYARPCSVIHELFDNKTFEAWGGMCRGAVQMQGENWNPYLEITPPFPEFPSGHSAFSRAAAELIKYFCDNDKYNETVTFLGCSSVIESTCTPAKEITLSWSTLDDAADEAGKSRRYGGIHFEDGDKCGQELGQKVAASVWQKACCYFNGLTSRP